MRLSVALSCAIVAFCFASTAAAYCRTTTCDPLKGDCRVDENDCVIEGEPLRWPNREVSVVTASGSARREIALVTANEVFIEALGAWTSVDCDDGPPSIAISRVDIDETQAPLRRSTEGVPGASDSDEPDGVNVLGFVEEGWTHDAGALALTTVSFGVKSGRIVDVDVEVNAEHDITLTDAAPAYDLLSLLTHEAGHFFGLSHATEMGPTMYAYHGGLGDLSLRSLEADDIAGMCAIYRPSRFDTQDGGCSCRSAGRAGRPHPAWLLAVFGVGYLRRRAGARGKRSVAMKRCDASR